MNGTCYKCSKYLPHPIFPYIGKCEELDIMTLGTGEPCQKYVEQRIEDVKEIFEAGGIMYCPICKEPIYTFEEYLKHKEHKPSKNFLIDETIIEETYPG
ncbi:MAG: hypothetical protein NDF58_07385 [archaeon YNP-LCB-024-027]|jgi:hypothetical protein|nr:hypothetical protein [Candidatus Culexarchaeum yellowstonense]